MQAGASHITRLAIGSAKVSIISTIIHLSSTALAKVRINGKTTLVDITNGCGVGFRDGAATGAAPSVFICYGRRIYTISNITPVITIIVNKN